MRFMFKWENGEIDMFDAETPQEATAKVIADGRDIKDLSWMLSNPKRPSDRDLDNARNDVVDV